MHQLSNNLGQDANTSILAAVKLVRFGTTKITTIQSDKLKFHWDQFPRNLPIAMLRGSHQLVMRKSGMSPASYEEADDFQTISTCPDDLACR